jgi:hypothetical protein
MLRKHDNLYLINICYDRLKLFKQTLRIVWIDNGMGLAEHKHGYSTTYRRSGHLSASLHLNNHLENS